MMIKRDSVIVEEVKLVNMLQRVIKRSDRLP
jgi:hypothetical protein